MHEQSQIELVRLQAEDVELLRALDRSEVVDGVYRQVGNELILSDHDEIVDGWPAGVLEKYLRPWAAAAAAGCPLIGARLEGKIVGLALVNPRHRTGLAQLMSLYIDRTVRRRGVAGRLCRSAFDLSREAGAASIYVSSSPTRGTVGFYWSQGFRPCAADTIDPQLYALEPNDIHMIKRL